MTTRAHVQFHGESRSFEPDSLPFTHLVGADEADVLILAGTDGRTRARRCGHKRQTSSAGRAWNGVPGRVDRRIARARGRKCARIQPVPTRQSRAQRSRRAGAPARNQRRCHRGGARALRIGGPSDGDLYGCARPHRRSTRAAIFQRRAPGPRRAARDGGRSRSHGDGSVSVIPKGQLRCSKRAAWQRISR